MMYKAIFIGLLLVLPTILAHTSPYEKIYEIGKRASVLEIVGKLLKDPRLHSLGCQATCTLLASWLSFLCPQACSVGKIAD